MSKTDKPRTAEAEKKRLVEALRKLHQEGVRILEDNPGRPRVAAQSQEQKSAMTRHSPFMDADQSFDLEDQVGTDPYNKPL